MADWAERHGWDRLKMLAAGYRECIHPTTKKRIFLIANEETQRDAIKTALAYGCGKPTERHELTGPDGGPIETKDTLDLSGLGKEDLLRLAYGPEGK